MDTQEIVTRIYDQEDAGNRGKALKPGVYDDDPGVTSCFIFTGIGKPGETPSAAFQALLTCAKEMEAIIQQGVLPCRLPNWSFVPHTPHVTAASVIDPLQKQVIPPEPAGTLLWQSLVVSFDALSRQFAPFTLVFDRLHIGPKGTVSIVAWPRSKQVGLWKQVMFHLYKSERWWEYPLDTEKVLDHSCQAVIGHVEPVGSLGAFSGLPSNLLAEMQNDLRAMAFPPKEILVAGVWLVQYSNRLIDPDKHLVRAEYFPFRAAGPAN